jgi:hypothetical protein
MPEKELIKPRDMSLKYEDLAWEYFKNQNNPLLTILIHIL